MNESTILLTLASIHFIALMSPGPDFALVVQNATRHGRQTGLYIALGLSVGILLHSLFSLTGVSYIVHQHPVLYSAIFNNLALTGFVGRLFEKRSEFQKKKVKEFLKLAAQPLRLTEGQQDPSKIASRNLNRIRRILEALPRHK